MESEVDVLIVSSRIQNKRTVQPNFRCFPIPNLPRCSFVELDS
jgi:hypothetical protein